MAAASSATTLFQTCVLHNHFTTRSAVHQSACGMCRTDFADSVYGTLVSQSAHGSRMSHTQFHASWQCVCNNGGYNAMRTMLAPCMQRQGIAGPSAMVREVTAKAVAVGEGGDITGATTLLVGVVALLIVVVALVGIAARRKGAATGGVADAML